ncbi:hypothetical protein AB0B06_08135 [Streptomyces sp. NPDC044989]|uniref:TlpA family protein disulfide reductase n=1 Tax=Streptomyces sp. NPDC044989 TaxID=3154336 RepID=UPI0033D28167
MQFAILAIAFVAAASSLTLSLMVAIRVKRLINPLVEEGAFKERPPGRDFTGSQTFTYEGLADVRDQPVTFPPSDDGPWILAFQSVDCPGCKSQLPAYRQYLEAQTLPRDRVISVISGGTDGIEIYEQLIGEYSRLVPVDEKNPIANDLGVEVWPTYMIVGPDGTVSVSHNNAAEMPRLETEPIG